MLLLQTNQTEVTKHEKASIYHPLVVRLGHLYITRRPSASQFNALTNDKSISEQSLASRNDEIVT